MSCWGCKIKENASTRAGSAEAKVSICPIPERRKVTTPPVILREG
jgi:hypothetical protein